MRGPKTFQQRRRSGGGCAGTQSADPKAELGFTLIELLVVIVILPLIVGAIAVALLAVFKNSSVASTTISQSGDTQVVSSEFVSDVQSASTLTTMTTPASPAVCATVNQKAVTGFASVVSFDSADGNTEISYVEVPDATSNNKVFRNFCQGASTIPVSTTAVARTAKTVQAIVSGSPCPQTLGQGPTCPVTSAWVSAAGTAYVKLTIAAPVPKSSALYTYSLQAAPRTANPGSSGLSSGGTEPVLLLGTSGNDWSCGGSLTIDTGQVVMNSTNGGASGGTITAPGGVYTANTGNPSGSVSGTTLQPAGVPVVSGPPIPDPYKNLTPPSIPALSPTNGGPVGGVFQPGLYTSTPSFGGDTLASGIYYLQNGMNIGPGTTTGNHVFIYIAGGAVSVNGNVTVTLTPLASPPSPAPNLTIWQAASDTNTLNFDGQGNGGTTVDGIIYAPSALVDILGSGTSSGLTTDALLAKGATCTGNHAPMTVTGNL